MAFLKYISFLTFLWIILSFILTYFYLKSLEGCACAIGEEGQKGFVDIKRLQEAQLAIIVIAVIDHFFLLNDRIDRLGIFKILCLIAIAIIYLNFIYYTYHLFQNISKECKCAEHWERYVLYKEFVLYGAIGVVLIGTMVFGVEHSWFEYLYKAGFVQNIRYLILSIFGKEKKS
jgi:hypothetical protein